MSLLGMLRSRVGALAVVIVLVLLAGAWTAWTSASAHEAVPSQTHHGTRGTTHHHRAAAEGPLRVVSVTPGNGARHVNGASAITVHFSAALAAGSPMPALRPAIAGAWHRVGAGELQFVPGTGFTEWTHVRLTIPGGPAGIVSAAGRTLATTVKVRFETGGYSGVRLVQLLTQLGYLPFQWAPTPGVTVPAAGALRGQLSAAYNPPGGAYTFDSGYPAELLGLWNGGSPSSVMIKGAVMAFESDHGLAMDGVAGPHVWHALLRAAAVDQSNPSGYTYALASEKSPETLTVWHDGRVILHSLANTGIAVAPTTIGTSPVYLRYRSQIMRGTNPNGTQYADPVSWVSYFRGGEAVHYFPRATYGWPQSLGCVELPYAQAKSVWPYMTYGTLVTVTAP